MFAKHSEKDIEAFFNSCHPSLNVFTFRYFAIKRDGLFVVLSGDLELGSSSATSPAIDHKYETDRIIAGLYQKRGAPGEAIRIARSLCESAKVSVGNQDFHFQAPQDGDFWVNYDPRPRLTRTSHGHPEMFIRGESISRLVGRADELDSELKAADKPFEDVSEVLKTLGMEPRLQDTVTARVRTTSVAQISEEATQSKIINGKAEIRVKITADIARKKVKLGWRCLSDGEFKSRGSIILDDTEWEDEKIDLGYVRSGSFELTVPQRASLQCFLSYEGRLQHEVWIHDSDPRGNVRWCFHALAERRRPGWLARELSSSGNDKSFEEATACLFSLLGFRTTRYCKPLEDGVDIFASTVEGDVLLIECCTDSTRAEKIEKLVDRHEKFLLAMGDEALNHTRTIPVMVIRQKRDAARTSAERGSDRGVITLDEDDLKSYIEHSRSRADAHLEIFEKLADRLADLNLPDDPLSLFTLADPPRRFPHP